MQPTQPNREAVAALAHQLWEKNGRPAGRDVEFWLQAERSVLSAAKPPPQAAVPAAAPANIAAPESASAAAKTSYPKAKRPNAKAAKGAAKPAK
jgi:hypothetical protein